MPMQEVGDRAGEAVVLNLTGIALGHEGRHRDAASVFEEAERIFSDLAGPVADHHGQDQSGLRIPGSGQKRTWFLASFVMQAR